MIIIKFQLVLYFMTRWEEICECASEQRISNQFNSLTYAITVS